MRRVGASGTAAYAAVVAKACGVVAKDFGSEVVHSGQQREAGDVLQVESVLVHHALSVDYGAHAAGLKRHLADRNRPTAVVREKLFERTDARLSFKKRRWRHESMKSKQCLFFRRQTYLLIGLWTLFATATAMSLFIMFQAGCAGDVKSGSLGDAGRALQLEGYGIVTALVSAGLSVAALVLTSKSVHRVTQAIAFATFFFVCLWIVGIQVEISGVQSCF